ncbi:hypothetical protein AB0P15_29385 [Streptomyces sp. NPDC087917]|uniref:hypothetical protein n=1 Tax=Streptomyces sp. NPDC087917 TaxID=3155060 RepID=UPI00343E445D
MIILMWLTRPSTGPEFQWLVKPWMTASQSFSRPVAKLCRPGQVFCSDGVDPVFEVLAGAGGENFGELFAVFVPESIGVAHHPAGDLADAWWCRADDTDALPAAGPQVVADGLVMA